MLHWGIITVMVTIRFKDWIVFTNFRMMLYFVNDITIFQISSFPTTNNTTIDTTQLTGILGNANHFKLLQPPPPISDFKLRCQSLSSLTPCNQDLEHRFSRPKRKFSWYHINWFNVYFISTWGLTSYQITKYKFIINRSNVLTVYQAGSGFLTCSFLTKFIKQQLSVPSNFCLESFYEKQSFFSLSILKLWHHFEGWV